MLSNLYQDFINIEPSPKKSPTNNRANKNAINNIKTNKVDFQQSADSSDTEIDIHNQSSVNKHPKNANKPNKNSEITRPTTSNTSNTSNTVSTEMSISERVNKMKNLRNKLKYNVEEEDSGAQNTILNRLVL